MTGLFDKSLGKWLARSVGVTLTGSVLVLLGWLVLPTSGVVVIVGLLVCGLLGLMTARHHPAIGDSGMNPVA